MKVKEIRNNAYIISDSNKIILQSYDSIVAIYEKENITLGKNWNYSITTLKHVYQFIEEYAPNLQIHNYTSMSKKANIQKLIDIGAIKYDKEII